MREPHDSLAMAEVPGRDLVQVAGWPASYPAMLAAVSTLVGCPPPADMRRAATAGGVTIFGVGPERLWIAAPAAHALGAKLRAALPPDGAAVTELGHGRTVLRIEGAPSAALLARAVAVDLDPPRFPAGSFAQTGLHRVGVLLHRTGEQAFDLYLPRSFAQSLREWLAEAATTLR